jgi:hypothetical protein
MSVTSCWADPITAPGPDARRGLLVRERPGEAPRLLDRVRTAIQVRHYSRRTEETCVGWIRRYVLFHGKRHPAEMGAVLERLEGAPRLVATLLYGSGLRLLEGLTLRVKDLDLARGEITVREGKGGRDLPHVPALVRDPPAGGRLRHPDGAGVARAQGCQHDHDLHARAQPGRTWGREPGGSVMGGRGVVPPRSLSENVGAVGGSQMRSRTAISERRRVRSHVDRQVRPTASAGLANSRWADLRRAQIPALRVRVAAPPRSRGEHTRLQ